MPLSSTHHDSDSFHLADRRYRVSWIATSFAALLSANVFAQGPRSLPTNYASTTGLTGGSIRLLATSNAASGSRVAALVDGVGLYVADAARVAAAKSVQWTAESCVPCAHARSLSWDTRGQLWVAASGLGLWKRAANGQYERVIFPESNIVEWVSVGADGTVWAILGNGSLKIAVDGTTQRLPSAGAGVVFDKILAPDANASDVIAASSGEVYALTDKGTWDALRSPSAPLVLERFENSIYIGTRNGAYRYTGTAWESLGPANTTVYAIAKTAGGALTVATEQRGALTLEGKSWVGAIDSENTLGRRARALAVDANGNVFAGLSSGVQTISTSVAGKPSRSQAAARAIAINETLNAPQIDAVASTKNKTFALVNGQGLMQRVGATDRWLALDAPLDEDARLLATNNDTLLVITESGRLLRYVDGQASAAWVEVSRDAADARALYIDDKGTIWMGRRNIGAVSSFDTNANRWIDRSKGLRGASGISQFVQTGDGSLWLGSTRSGVFRWNAALAEWQSAVVTGLPNVHTRTGFQVSPINAIATAGGRIYVGTDHGVFMRSTTEKIDAGAWVKLSDDLKEKTVTRLAVDATGNLVVGTNFGAFMLSAISPTRSEKWLPYGDSDGDAVAAVAALDTEWLVATKPRPGKPSRVLVGR
jgi:ligand-binding sensor domain-containing protein